MNNPIYILGDIHGNFESLLSDLKRYDIHDCTIICVGDVGIGFVHPMKQFAINSRMNEWFACRNISFLAIRGNHDDPTYFSGKNKVTLSNFELLEDYTMRTINDERFLFIGGAVSVDRIHRKIDVSYWKDESLVYISEKIQECDILITHTAPTWNGPLDKVALNSFVSNWETSDPTLWDECLQERKYVDSIIRESKAKMQYCGHFHSYHFVEFNGCYSTILSIDQLKEHRTLTFAD